MTPVKYGQPEASESLRRPDEDVLPTVGVSMPPIRTEAGPLRAVVVVVIRPTSSPSTSIQISPVDCRRTAITCHRRRRVGVVTTHTPTDCARGALTARG